MDPTAVPPPDDTLAVALKAFFEALFGAKGMNLHPLVWAGLVWLGTTAYKRVYEGLVNVLRLFERVSFLLEAVTSGTQSLAVRVVEPAKVTMVFDPPADEPSGRHTTPRG